MWEKESKFKTYNMYKESVHQNTKQKFEYKCFAHVQRMLLMCVKWYNDLPQCPIKKQKYC